ncbi:uroporphyrinogen-III synthase [Marinobacteraceae bacterium S3BR75-40.1]
MATNPANAKGRPLAGLHILNGRPQGQAAELTRALEAAGARVRELPLLEIVPLPETAEQRAVLQNLDQYQHVIAVSPNAAHFLTDALDRWWPQTPVGIHWYGVGAGTARVLTEAGLMPRIPEAGHDSEALLQRPELQTLTGEKVLLCRGRGGRETLPETLEARGARVTRLAFYERRCPAYTETTLKSALVDFAPQVIVVMSGETLNNLIALGQNTDHQLLSRTVLVPVARVAEQARERGFTQVLVPDALDPASIMACLADHRKGPEAP